MRILLILTLLLTSLNCFAVTPISKGEPAPHSGYIFTKAEEKKVRKIREQKLKLEDLIVLKNKSIDLKNRRIEVLEKRVKNNRLGFWGKIGYTMLGVVMTSTALYGANKLLRR